MVLLAGALVRRNLSVTLFAEAHKVAVFSPADPAYDVIDFSTGTSVAALRTSKRQPAWIDRLPDLGDFDLVVCDNLPDILAIRPDAVLSGSFLWHTVVDGIHNDHVSSHEALIDRYKPQMLTCSLFSMPDVSRWTRPVPVPLYGAARQNQGRNLLLACGNSGEANHLARDLIAMLCGVGKGSFERVYVEPALMPSSAPSWMSPAKFDAEMYAHLSAALVRPGIGTITDALLHGCRIFSFFEAGNREMVHNATRLEELGLGEMDATPEQLLQSCLSYSASSTAQAEHERHLARHVFDRGEEHAASFIVAQLGRSGAH